ncbi:Rv1733c family protein [Streptomyces adustus]|uniref:Rv1733c family protein n=1 Tax=Streptomyces adustus TaxID=1609272 RepID=UPI003718D06B
MVAREISRNSRRPPEDPPGVLLWRLRRNPLRRRNDVVQGWIALGLFLAVTAATPAAMFLVGDAAYRHHRQTARDEAAVRHHTPAVLLYDVPRHPEPGSPEAKLTRYPVTVRFTDPHGHSRTARADVEPALSAGSEVRVWVSDEGKITEPPLSTEQIRNRTMGAAMVAALTVPVIGVAAYGWAARRLERRNLVLWDIAWARTAPRWTTST